MTLTVAADYTCAGHWTLAAQMSGHKPVWHRSPFRLATRVLNQNYPSLPLGGLDAMPAGHQGNGWPSGLRRPEVFVGSPPCVGFTRANPNRANQGPDRQHVLLWARAASKLATRAVVMEMCPGWRDGWPEHDKYHRILRDAGWRTAEYTWDAWDLGGTQRRVRAFVVATRGGRDPRTFQPRRRPGTDPAQVLRQVRDPGRFWVPDDVTRGPFGLALKWRKRRVVPGKPCYAITQRALQMIYHPTLRRSLGTNELAAIMGFPPNVPEAARPRPPATYWLPTNSTAMQLIGPGVDIRCAASILRDLGRWL